MDATNSHDYDEALSLLHAFGVTTECGDSPQNYLKIVENITKEKAPPPSPSLLLPQEATETAENLAKNIHTLDGLLEAIKAFEGCALKRSARQCVFADGNPQSEIMLIGEAPGADEDREGKPFVGRSGQLLDKMLHSIGLNREKNIYITNIIFWRPPGNRTPTALEISACLPFVKRHIELISPKLIILCGSIALQALTDRKEGIMKLHGKDLTLDVNGKQFQGIATFHPSYLLRTPLQKRAAWEDLKRIKSIIN